ncbi:ranBP2-type domain-containing protein, partial [Caerostris extrusa]
DEKPPQLPQRSLKPNEFSGSGQGKENLPGQMPGHIGTDGRNGTLDPSHMNNMQDFNREIENQWNNNIMDNRQINTLNRQFPPEGECEQYFCAFIMFLSLMQLDIKSRLFKSRFTSEQHASKCKCNRSSKLARNGRSSWNATYALSSLSDESHLPPHYPYPMYPPQFPNYPQYFGNSFANLSSQPTTTDGDFSDHSEASSRQHSGRKYPFRKRAKRSQSVMVDRMAFPGQFYPFGPFPPGYGPGPWGAPYPMEAPPSPASSVRSLNRMGRTRRRKKLTSEDDDEEFSMSSSPMSRPKSSSSERPLPAQKSGAKPAKSSSEEEESDEEDKRDTSRNNRKDRTLKRDSDPRRLPSPLPKSPQITHKKTPKHKDRDTLKQSDAEYVQMNLAQMERDLPENQTEADIQTPRMHPLVQQEWTEDLQEIPTQVPFSPHFTNIIHPTEKDPSASVWTPPSSWQCNHCTFINPAGNRICQVCCKTATVEESALVTSRPASASASASSKTERQFREELLFSRETSRGRRR